MTQTAVLPVLNYIAGEWVDGYRAMRIARLIEAGGKLSLEDITTMHMDCLSIPAREFLDLLAGTGENRAPTVREGTYPIHLAIGRSRDARESAPECALSYSNCEWFRKLC